MVLDNILSLKHFIETALPNARVRIYNYIIRKYDGKVTLIVNRTNRELSALQFNTNDRNTCLNRNNSHLNGHGKGKLATNLLAKSKV